MFSLQCRRNVFLLIFVCRPAALTEPQQGLSHAAELMKPEWTTPVLAFLFSLISFQIGRMSSCDGKLKDPRLTPGRGCIVVVSILSVRGVRLLSVRGCVVVRVVVALPVVRF